MSEPCARARPLLPPKTCHVVVARHNEDSQWAVEKFGGAASIYLYNKGSQEGHGTGLRDASLLSKVHYEELPNVGRESHTYLHHIIQHYDALPEVLHFTQGSLGDHHWWTDKIQSFLDFEGSFQAIPFQGGDGGPLREADVPEDFKATLAHTNLKISEWARDFVDPLISDDDPIKYFTNGIFSLLRHRVLSRPREDYVRLKGQLEVSSNPLSGHYCERLWHRIFNCHVPQATTIVSCFYLLRSANMGREALTPESEQEEEEAWFKNCSRTCSLRHPMVIFVDEARRAQRLEALRAAFGLADLTRVVHLPFEGLAMAPWLEKVETNRAAYWPTRDARCEAKVHLLMLSRFDLVARVAAWNPFGSTHVCQMDLSILSKRPNNCSSYTDDGVFAKLDAILSRPRPVCTALVVQPWHPHWFLDLRAFYSSYMYQMAGTFWTADLKTASSLATLAKQVAEDFTEAGYGHGDEHVFARVVDLAPDLFTLTMGDYQDIVDNYFRPTANLGRVEWMFDYAERLEPDGVLLKKLRECNEVPR